MQRSSPLLFDLLEGFCCITAYDELMGGGERHGGIYLREIPPRQRRIRSFWSCWLGMICSQVLLIARVLMLCEIG